MVAGAAMTGVAMGGVSFDIQGGMLKTAANANLPTSSLVMLMVDTGGNGFGGITAGNFSVGTVSHGDDVVAWMGNLAFGVDGILANNTGTLNPAGISANWTDGKALGVYWFDGVAAGSSSTSDTPFTATISTGIKFGMYTGPGNAAPDPVASHSQAWTTPSGSVGGSVSNYKLYFLDSVAGPQAIGGGAYSSVPNFAAAPFTVVPEPSTLAFGHGAAALGLAVARRRRS